MSLQNPFKMQLLPDPAFYPLKRAIRRVIGRPWLGFTAMVRILALLELLGL
jgi:hypothetical protein